MNQSHNENVDVKEIGAWDPDELAKFLSNLTTESFESLTNLERLDAKNKAVIDAALEIMGVEVSWYVLHREGMEIVGDPTWDECDEKVSEFKVISRSVHFWLGDLLNYMETKWGERYTQALDEHDFKYQTLANDKWVTGSVDISRRSRSLSFGHHEAVAVLEPKDQTRVLRIAEKRGLSVPQIREVKKRVKAGKKIPDVIPEPPTYDHLSNRIHTYEKAKRMVRALFVVDRVISTGVQGNIRKRLAKKRIKVRRWLFNWAAHSPDDG